MSNLILLRFLISLSCTAQVELLEEADGWMLVRDPGGREGLVPASYLQIDALYQQASRVDDCEGWKMCGVALRIIECLPSCRLLGLKFLSSQHSPLHRPAPSL